MSDTGDFQSEVLSIRTAEGWKVTVVVSPEDLTRLSRGEQIRLAVDHVRLPSLAAHAASNGDTPVAAVTLRMLERRATPRT